MGMQAPTPTFTTITRIFTVVYFGFFVALYIISGNEKTKPVPDRVTDK